MYSLLRVVVLSVFFFSMVTSGFAQVEEIEFSKGLDSVRAVEDNKQDSVVFTAKYVRYATLAMLKQGTFTKQIDTSHRNFQYYNKQNLPWNPSINLGAYGLATRNLLFTPDKSIGFQPGFHALERNLVTSDSIRYYRARARYSELYSVGFFFEDQVFRATIAQNITPQWNIGAQYYSTKTEGFYNNQNYGESKANVFTWYESKNHRYNLLANYAYNRLDATENGSILNDSIFKYPIEGTLFGKEVRLNGKGLDRPYNKWNDASFFIRQSYYLGRLDSVNGGLPTMEVFPTNAIAHNSSVRIRKYIFHKNEPDIWGALPYRDAILVEDTTKITTVSNEFTYSFYLRNKSLLKNEAKLTLGFQNDLIWYSDSLATNLFYQNSMLKGDIGYKFSDRVNLAFSANQIVVGHNFGDFLYEAQSDILLGEKVGKISIGAYSQNKSPEMAFERMNYTYQQWSESLDKTKIQNLSFQYSNPKIRFSGKAEYFLINKYTYYQEVPNPDNLRELDKIIKPAQYGNLNLLKITLTEDFKFGKFNLDNRVVFQKSDAMKILATPELYTWHSLYYTDVWSKVLNISIGMDVRFNTPFTTPSYAISVGQFYNDNEGIEFSTYPIVDFWVTANIKRVNLFLSNNFTNQYIYPRGYYSVRRYPMNPANFRFGVSWKFYD